MRNLGDALYFLAVVLFFFQSCSCDVTQNLEFCSRYGLSYNQCKVVNNRALSDDLLNIIHSVIENGVPSFGIPPLDPLNYEGNIHVDHLQIQDLIELDFLNADNIHSTKLNQFISNKLQLNILRLTLEFNFTFPEINFDLDHYNISGIIMSAIPFDGDGALDVTVRDVTVSGKVQIGTKGILPAYIYLRSLDFDLELRGSKIWMTGLMGGSRVTYMASEIASEALPNIVKLYKSKVLPELIDEIVTIVNGVLDELKLTVMDIINCISGGSCPIPMP